MKVIQDKVKFLDTIIPNLLFPLLILDMINGIMHENNIEYLLSVSQLYKLMVILLFCVRLLANPKVLMKIVLYAILLFIPTLVKVCLNEAGLNVLFYDLIRTSKYLIIIISFYYFKEVLLGCGLYFNVLYKWIRFSFWVLAINLLGKIVGLGYPMYETGDIGTRGFFIAGNEISALLIVLSSIVGYYNLVIKKDKKLFVFYAIFSFVLGLLISSKTGMLGIVLIYALILLGTYDYTKKITTETIIKVVGGISIICTTLVLFVLNTSIFGRYFVFWKKLDFLTFVLSSRNLYFHETVLLTNDYYRPIDYFFGIGPTLYHELASRFVEIDFIDVFFSYGVLGLVVLSQFYITLFGKAFTKRKFLCFPFAKLTLILLMLLILLSFLSGHILNSGISGIFMGFAFALMYYQDKSYK